MCVHHSSNATASPIALRYQDRLLTLDYWISSGWGLTVDHERVGGSALALVAAFVEPDGSDRG